jgi:hypothetical protein
VDESRLRLQDGNAGDSSVTQDLLQALSALRNSRNGLISSWINYEVSRITLFVDLELLLLDEEGRWINEDQQLELSETELEELIDSEEVEELPLEPILEGEPNSEVGSAVEDPLDATESELPNLDSSGDELNPATERAGESATPEIGLKVPGNESSERNQFGVRRESVARPERASWRKSFRDSFRETVRSANANATEFLRDKFQR